MARPLLDDDPDRVGAWRLTGRLGEGGFGVVYLGVRDDGRWGAVKVMHRHLAREEGYVARFGREVALARRVQGDHIAPVVDSDLEVVPPYLVTAYVDGPTLHEEVARNGTLSGDNLYALALALAEAISSITAAGVVHRDLKPGNVLLTERSPVVVDFGIASAAGLERLTATGLIMGTSQFMAPEQFTGGEASPAIDVFAWASVVHFAANGRAPFRDDSGNASAVMYQVLHHDPEPGALAGALADIVADAHAKDPGSRPTPSQLVERLVALRAPAEDDPVRTSTMLVERTWHLVPEPPPPPPTAPPPTPVAPAPPARVVPADAPMPNIEYTPPRRVGAPSARATSPLPPPPPGRPAAPRPAPPSPASPSPSAPAPAPPPAAARYPITWLTPWAQRLPDFGKLGTACALVYLFAGQSLDGLDDGVVPADADQQRVADAWEAAWGLRPLVVLLVLGFAAQRVVRAVVKRRGLSAPEWRGYAAASSLLGLGLSLVPVPTTAVLAYGPLVLEPADRLSIEQAVAAGTGALAIGVLAVVGLVFAVRAAIHVAQSLIGTVVWQGAAVRS